MLRSVPAPAEEQRPKRSFPELVTAIYEDERVGHEARELLLAVAYAVDLAKREEGISPLNVACRKLGVERGRRARYDRLVADDAPRYQPPAEVERMASQMPCAGPRLRPYKQRPYTPRTNPAPDLVQPTPLREPPPPALYTDLARDHTYTPPRDWRTEDGVCGAAAHHQVLEKDPRTGWITAHWFCKRHKEHADRVAKQVSIQNEQAPEPFPNAGGLLPCYFKADWEKVYRHYRPRWEPPSYGLCADDWPTSGSEARPARHMRLRVIDGVDGAAGD